MKRKFFAAFMSLCMVMSLLPMTVLAAEESPDTVGTSQQTETSVASVTLDDGTVTYYDSFKDAFQNATSGSTIQLVKDTSTEKRFDINSAKSIVLDLNGKTITSTIANQFMNLNNADAELTITDTSDSNSGKIVLTQAGIGFCVFRGTLNIEKGTVESQGHWTSGGSEFGQQVVYLFGGNNSTDTNYTNFTLGSDAKITSVAELEDGTEVGSGYAVTVIHRSSAFKGAGDVAYGVNVDIHGSTENAILYVNGTIKATEGNVPNLILHDGATIDGGIYAAGYANWVINGATVTGGTGMEIRAGILTVNDGSIITGTSTPTAVEPNGNGSTTDGAGIAVAQHTTRLPINVTINGGAISGYSAFYQSNPQNNDADSIAKVAVKINGGNFTSINDGTCVVYSANKTGFIAGGTFSKDPSKNTEGEDTNYLATGYAITEQDGKYVAGLKTDVGMEAGGTATGTTSTGTVGGSFANDENKDEGVTTSNKNLTINVATGSTVEEGGEPTRNTAVTSTTVTIANQSLTSVKESENISNVTIFTDVGSLTLDKDAWSKITTDAGNNSVVLSLSKESDTAETGASQIYEITATVNGKEIYTEGNADGSVEVDVPYNRNAPTVYYLGPDGAEKIDSSHKDGILSWTVEHFSFYAVCAEEQEASVTTSAGKTTCYDTLEGAIDFAQDGDTVKLLKDVIVASNGTASSSGAIVIDDAITLDGNGKSINAADGFDDTNIINIVNSGEVTIKDVTINGKGQSRHCINIWSATDTSEPCNVTLENVKTTGGLTGVTAGGSTLTIQGVETNIATGSWGVAVNLDSTNSAKNPASLTVKEGTIGNIYIENNANVNGTTAEISGGNIQDVVLQNVESGVKLTITDGNINDVREVSKGSDGNLTDKNPTDMITITGGTFHEDVSDYLADGLVQNADGSVGKPYVPPANPNYKITIGDMENGTVTANPTAAKAGATVTLTPVPDEGYALSTLTVTDRFGDAVRVTEQADGTYTFPMPNGQVTVTATFVETEEPVDEPFVDVAEGDWFYDAVVYAYQNELMDGVGGNRFAPNSETTRAQLVTILYRLEGEPAVSGDLPFTDVESGTWYTDAILWAAQNNIVNGVSDTEFAPGDDLTRQQLVTILYRYAEAKGYDVSASADLSGYPDAGQVQAYAQPAMAWAVAENIIQGMEDGTLKPAGNASRAQIATILMRFCEDVAQ